MDGIRENPSGLYISHVGGKQHTFYALGYDVRSRSLRYGSALANNISRIYILCYVTGYPKLLFIGECLPLSIQYYDAKISRRIITEILMYIRKPLADE